MSAVTDHHGHHDDHAYHPGGIMRWITTTNHKAFVGFANIAYEILSNQPRPPLWS